MMWDINMLIILSILVKGVDRCNGVCGGHPPYAWKAHSCQEIWVFYEYDRYSENAVVENDKTVTVFLFVDQFSTRISNFSVWLRNAVKLSWNNSGKSSMKSVSLTLLWSVLSLLLNMLPIFHSLISFQQISNFPT